MTAPPRDFVTRQREDAVLILSLNRPERLNAIDLGLLQALNEALAAGIADPEVRVLVLCGEGRAFCAGDDLVAQVEAGALDDQRMRQFVNALQQVTRHLMLGDKPVVALVQGWAIGGGFSWTLNADFSIWADTARAYLPELGFGMFVSGGLTHLLPHLAGRAKAAELAMTGRRVDATELNELGIAWRVVPAAELREQGLRFAHELAALPAAGLAHFKRALLGSELAGLEAALQAETDACLACARDPQTVQRIEQFLAQRS